MLSGPSLYYHVLEIGLLLLPSGLTLCLWSSIRLQLAGLCKGMVIREYVVLMEFEPARHLPYASVTSTQQRLAVPDESCMHG